uniref:Uncharacterized protein n=1 Tax=Mycena chlorophos TaxID=658473 RepID=A0ABQ0M3J3_MYCCL|nr:predicted protein [Mycena chlorophos]
MHSVWYDMLTVAIPIRRRDERWLRGLEELVGRATAAATVLGAYLHIGQQPPHVPDPVLSRASAHLHTVHIACGTFVPTDNRRSFQMVLPNFLCRHHA